MPETRPLGLKIRLLESTVGTLAGALNLLEEYCEVLVEEGGDLEAEQVTETIIRPLELLIGFEPEDEPGVVSPNGKAYRGRTAKAMRVKALGNVLDVLVRERLRAR